MLLRRITEHVRQQNWTAITIDFVIVVVGVFIGIQVSNWNDERLRQQTELEYIERIRDDLRANKEDLTQRLQYFGQVRGHALAALDAFEQSSETLGEQFVVDLYQATHMLQREFGRDTYDEILSVGANNAIADVATRQRLSTFYRSIKAQITLLDFIPPYREIIRRSFPYSVSKAMRSNCGDVVLTEDDGSPVIFLPEECDPGLTDGQISEAISEVFELDIHKDLARRITNLDAKLWALQLMLDRIELLESELPTP